VQVELLSVSEKLRRRGVDVANLEGAEQISAAWEGAQIQPEDYPLFNEAMEGTAEEVIRKIYIPHAASHKRE
jgi:hypothetical protein